MLTLLPYENNSVVCNIAGMQTFRGNERDSFALSHQYYPCSFSPDPEKLTGVMKKHCKLSGKFLVLATAKNWNFAIVCEIMVNFMSVCLLIDLRFSIPLGPLYTNFLCRCSCRPFLPEFVPI